jgi:hypothetical protein
MAEKKRMYQSAALASLPSIQSVLGEIPAPNPPGKEKPQKTKRETNQKA